MPYQDQTSSTPLPSQPEVQPTPHGPRFARVRDWLKSPAGRVVVPLIALLAGIVLGIMAFVFFGQSSGGSIAAVQESTKGDIIVEADRTFVTQLVTKNLAGAGLPGQIQNVNVNLKEGNQMIVSGEDGLRIFGVQVNRPFTFVVQFYVDSCFLKIHIIHADFSNIPVTSFVQSFESQINQQLQTEPEGLPSGFQYCTTGVRSEPGGIFITYSAIPV